MSYALAPNRYSLKPIIHNMQIKFCKALLYLRASPAQVMGELGRHRHYLLLQ